MNMGMKTGKNSAANSAAAPRTMRVWPAIVAPLGLTMLLLVAAGLFTAKVSTDQERADAEALKLEGYARLEAGELIVRSRELARAFVEQRLKQRSEQERNMRVELRGVMDAVYRVLTAGLEKTRSSAGTALRDVGEFPSGFESLRLFLELADDRQQSEDAPVAALHACATELTALLPPGCSLAVVENNFEELLSLGGGNVPEQARAETIAREFIWDDGTQDRHWTIQVRLAEADDYPLPDARELARHLDSRMGGTTLSDAGWRGWLVDQSGQAAAAFPLNAEKDAQGNDVQGNGAPPFIDKPGEWVDLDGKRLVWLERGNKLDSSEFSPAVAVAIDRPAPPLEWRSELARDKRWGLTLGLLGLFSLGTWLWFLRALWLAKQRSAPDQPERLSAERRLSDDPPATREKERPSAARAALSALGAEAALRGGRLSGGDPDGLRRRLVRDGAAQRTLDDVQGLIVADIGDDGEVEVGAEIVRQNPKRRMVIPSGSLLRLQERHRGGKGRRSSRVLDQAKSQLLRELAKRVRPVLTAGASMPPLPPEPEAEPAVRAMASTPRRGGRATERIVPGKAPLKRES